MPIRWSALKVVEAMDEVEKLLDQAEPFLADAKAKAGKATGITNLPQYMDQRIHRLIYTIEARDRIRDSISGIRKCIPQDAIVAETQAGKQQGFDL